MVGEISIVFLSYVANSYTQNTLANYNFTNYTNVFEC